MPTESDADTTANMRRESENPVLHVLYGGTSAEREVSLASGKSVIDALQSLQVRVRQTILESDALPDGLDASAEVIFPVLHGTFGEDGELQALLEREGFEFVGSDAVASRVCIDKVECKKRAVAAGVPVIESVEFEVPNDGLRVIPDTLRVLGGPVVIKPVAQGSSVGLHLLESVDALADVLDQLTPGRWLAEKRILGHDLTVGVLDGKAMGVVEILPASGVYDYKHKYTSGLTRYRFPAELPAPATQRLQSWAEAVFEACGCRDFARIDFMTTSTRDAFWFLEINTLPGMTETSLLPKSASCVGLDFPGLVRRMSQPAIERFRKRIQP